MHGMHGMHGMGGMGGRPQGPRKDQAIEVKLACTLEELYNGTVKKMKISRQVGLVSLKNGLTMRWRWWGGKGWGRELCGAGGE